jgi:hypothetical protein
MQTKTALIGLPFFLSKAISAPTVPLPRQNHQEHDHSEAWDASKILNWPIHSSCNASQARLIEHGLEEAVELARHAKQHILLWGNASDIYRKYFGQAQPYEAIGSFDIIVNGDRNGTLFRCDNPDGNCELEGELIQNPVKCLGLIHRPGWGGHWRGENATDETVICDLSYQTRRSLVDMCMMGYSVSKSETNTFWASDLMHRLYHMPAIGGDYIDHFTEDYAEVLEAAERSSINSTHDSDVLQYFALEAYAYDIAVPGKGCPGSSSTSGTSTSGQAVSTASAAPSVSTTALAIPSMN